MTTTSQTDGKQPASVPASDVRRPMDGTVTPTHDARPTTHDFTALDAILARYPAEEASLIQVLQDVQRAYRFLPCEALSRVAGALHVPAAKVFSVATFYKAFSLTPVGRVVVKVCLGTACHIRGAGLVLEEIERRAGVHPGQTRADGEFTLLTVNCVGACAMAPVVIVDEKVHGAAKAAAVPGMLGLPADGGAA
jgi:NADH-quinone oxidoreductase subunit E